MSVRLDGALSDDSSDLDSGLWTGFARMAAAALLVAALLITLWIDSRPESRRGAGASCRCAGEKAATQGGAACPCGRAPSR